MEIVLTAHKVQDGMEKLAHINLQKLPQQPPQQQLEEQMLNKQINHQETLLVPLLVILLQLNLIVLLLLMLPLHQQLLYLKNLLLQLPPILDHNLQKPQVLNLPVMALDLLILKTLKALHHHQSHLLLTLVLLILQALILQTLILKEHEQ